jgi:hypothetical protein
LEPLVTTHVDGYLLIVMHIRTCFFYGIGIVCSICVAKDIWAGEHQIQQLLRVSRGVITESFVRQLFTKLSPTCRGSTHQSCSTILTMMTWPNTIIAVTGKKIWIRYNRWQKRVILRFTKWTEWSSKQRGVVVCYSDQHPQADETTAVVTLPDRQHPITTALILPYPTDKQHLTNACILLLCC